MELDITIHRKDKPWWNYFWCGRKRFGFIRDLMVEKHNYRRGEDLLITNKIVKDLLNITHKNLIEANANDMCEYADFYIQILFIYKEIIDSNEDWCFKATW